MTEPSSTDCLMAIALLQQPGLGSTALRAILCAAREHGVSLDEWIALPPGELARRVDAPVAAQVIAARPLNLKRAERIVRAMDALGGRVHLVTDAIYPHPLHDLPEPPPIVFLMGNHEVLNEPAGAVVGARAAPPEGLRLAAESAVILASEGPVVSGGAEGVDLAAHAAALDASRNTPMGKSIVVLPQGIATYEPPAFITRALDEHRLLAISAELPFDAWETHRAVGRNPIIAALSRVVVVIEPGKTGGSIRTAEVALALGRRVFVWGSEAQRGTVERLIAMGARPLLNEDGCVQADALREGMRQPPVSPNEDRLLF